MDAGNAVTGGRLVRRALALVVLFGLSLGHPAAAQSLWDNLLVGVELAIGESVAQSVRDEYGGPARLTRAEQQRIERVFADIVAQAGRKEIAYNLTVLESDVVNAFAAPGGRIFLTTGLLREIANDIDALANVLGHEVAHVEHKHGMSAVARQLGLGLLLQFFFGQSDDVVQQVAAFIMELTRLGWSREQEHDSDALGQELAAAAGYDPQGMVRFFERLSELQGQEIAFLEFLSTHPLTSDRIERARARASVLQSGPRPDVQAQDPGTGAPEAGAGGDGGARVITRVRP